MAEVSPIAWTRSTFNPWIGCTKVGPGCDHCYAEALDKRMRYGNAVHWGAGVPRYRTSKKNWDQVLKWNEQARLEASEGFKWRPSAMIGHWPVFCASLADVFDNEAPAQWRTDLWKLIYETQNLSWLLVTKRIGNVERMVPSSWLHGFPEGPRRFPENVRLLITVCNQEEADRDVPKLLVLPCKNGISCEPALGPVDFRAFFRKEACSECGGRPSACRTLGHRPLTDRPAWNNGLDWIIVGGESTQGAGKARPFDLAWARSAIAQCKAAGVPVFVKQLGSHPYCEPTVPLPSDRSPLKDRAGADPTEWPEDLRLRQFPA